MSREKDIMILEITEHQVPVIKRDEIDLTLSIRTEPGPGEQSVQLLCRDLDAAGIKKQPRSHDTRRKYGTCGTGEEVGCG